SRDVPISDPRLARAARRALAALALLAVASSALAALGAGGTAPGRALQVAAVAGVALATVARAVLVQAERPAWAVLGAGMTTWAVGEVLHVVGVGAAVGEAVVADVLYAAFYPCAFVALALLVRARVEIRASVVWFDGLVVALALTAVAALVGD